MSEVFRPMQRITATRKQVYEYRHARFREDRMRLHFRLFYDPPRWIHPSQDMDELLHPLLLGEIREGHASGEDPKAKKKGKK